MAEFAPGLRVLIRDDDWMIRKCDPNSFNTYTLQCVGVSSLVRDKTANFLSDLEKITVIEDPDEAVAAFAEGERRLFFVTCFADKARLGQAIRSVTGEDKI